MARNTCVLSLWTVTCSRWACYRYPLPLSSVTAILSLWPVTDVCYFCLVTTLLPLMSALWPVTGELPFRSFIDVTCWSCYHCGLLQLWPVTAVLLLRPFTFFVTTLKFVTVMCYCFCLSDLCFTYELSVRLVRVLCYHCNFWQLHVTSVAPVTVVCYYCSPWQLCFINVTICSCYQCSQLYLCYICDIILTCYSCVTTNFMLYYTAVSYYCCVLLLWLGTAMLYRCPVTFVLPLWPVTAVIQLWPATFTDVTCYICVTTVTCYGCSHSGLFQLFPPWPVTSVLPVWFVTDVCYHFGLLQLLPV